MVTAIKNQDTKQALAEVLKATIRDIPNFPKPGIIFKDITPVLLDPTLSQRLTIYMAEEVKAAGADLILGVESRGFWFGPSMAMQALLPFVPVRKVGKLPYKTVTKTYALEYGESTIELHEDVLRRGMKVWIHDDLLATGGTSLAAAQLAQEQGAVVVGFSFLVTLDFLNGSEKLKAAFPDAAIEQIVNL